MLTEPIDQILPPPRRYLSPTVLETIHIICLAFDGIGAGRYSEDPVAFPAQAAKPVCLHGMVRWVEAPADQETWYMNMDGLSDVCNKAGLDLNVVDMAVRRVNQLKKNLTEWDARGLSNHEEYNTRISFEEFCEATGLEPLDDGTEEYGADFLETLP